VNLSLLRSSVESQSSRPFIGGRACLKGVVGALGFSCANCLKGLFLVPHRGSGAWGIIVHIEYRLVAYDKNRTRPLKLIV